MRKNKNLQVINRDKFYLYIENCKLDFYNIANTIPKSWGFTIEHQLKLYDFLFNEKRNKAVFTEFEYKLR